MADDSPSELAFLADVIEDGFVVRAAARLCCTRSDCRVRSWDRLGLDALALGVANGWLGY